MSSCGLGKVLGALSDIAQSLGETWHPATATKKGLVQATCLATSSPSAQQLTPLGDDFGLVQASGCANKGQELLTHMCMVVDPLYIDKEAKLIMHCLPALDIAFLFDISGLDKAKRRAFLPGP